MSWVSVAAFNIGIGRIDPILIPSPLSSPHIAIKVSDVKRRKWRKAGDLWQRFTGGVIGEPIFIPFGEQRMLDMKIDLGEYHLFFQPVSYHQGLFIEISQWIATSKKIPIDIEGLGTGMIFYP